MKTEEVKIGWFSLEQRNLCIRIRTPWGCKYELEDGTITVVTEIRGKDDGPPNFKDAVKVGIVKRFVEALSHHGFEFGGLGTQYPEMKK